MNAIEIVLASYTLKGQLGSQVRMAAPGPQDQLDQQEQMEQQVCQFVYVTFRSFLLLVGEWRLQMSG